MSYASGQNFLCARLALSKFYFVSYNYFLVFLNFVILTRGVRNRTESIIQFDFINIQLKEGCKFLDDFDDYLEGLAGEWWRLVCAIGRWWQWKEADD